MIRKRTVRRVIVVAVLIAVIPVVVAAQSVGIDWLSNADAAFSRAEQENRPLFVMITGGVWCDPCLWMEENTLRDRSIVSTVERGWVPLRLLDTDAVTQRWERGILPTVLFLDSSGTEIDRLEGTYTVDMLRRRIAEAYGVARGSPTEPPAATVQRDEEDLESQIFAVADGTIRTDGRGAWYTSGLDLPERFEEYDRDETFLYLRDRSTATIIAITVTDSVDNRRLWRWDQRENGWIQLGVLRPVQR